MSLFAPKERRSAVTLDDLMASFDRMPFGTWGGVPVTPRTALGHPAVWRCLLLIAGTISGLPVDAYRKQGKVRVEVTPTPDLLVVPSGVIDRRAWTWQAIESLVFDGNIVGQVVRRDANMRPAQVELVDMACVAVRKNRQTQLWEWAIDGKPVPAEQVWHVAMNPPPGHILGRSLLEHARDVIGLGLASQKYAGQFFGDGAHPTMIVKNTLSEIDQTQAKIIKERVMGALRGKREPLVVGRGYEVSPWQSNPAGAALVDVWASNTTNVANFFGVDAEWLGGHTSGGSITYMNVEARRLDFLQFCINLWMNPLEQKLSLSLVPPQFAKFNLDAFLRADTSTRFNVHDKAIRAGIASINEVRALEDLPPIPSGDEYLWPPYRAFPTGDERE